MTSDQMPSQEGPDQPVGDIDHALLQLLGDAALWEEPDPRVGESVVAAIAAGGVQPAPQRWARDGDRSRGRDAAVGAVLGVAAAIVLLLVAVGLDVVRIDRPRSDAPGTVVAMQAADAGPSGAVAAAAFHDLPDGTRIELQVSELPPAPEGQWYEMQLLRPGAPPVSAGSFHMRGGGGRVVLWAGIGLASDVVVEITREPEGTTLLEGRP